MSEIKAHSVLPFPDITSSGEVSGEFWRESEILREFWDKPAGDYEAEVRLPQVVGYVPSGERGLFDTLKHPGIVDPDKIDRGLDLEALQRLFPGIWATVRDDLGRLGIRGIDDPTNAQANLRRRFVLADHFSDGQLHRGDAGPYPEGDWHLDNPSRSFRASENGVVTGPSPDLTYEVRNRNSALYYEGPMTFHVEEIGRNGSDSRLKTVNLAEPIDLSRGVAVPAPDYGIVRLGPLSPHSCAVLPEDAWGTDLRIRVTPDQDLWSLNLHPATSSDLA